MHHDDMLKETPQISEGYPTAEIKMAVQETLLEDERNTPKLSISSPTPIKDLPDLDDKGSSVALESSCDYALSSDTKMFFRSKFLKARNKAREISIKTESALQKQRLISLQFCGALFASYLIPAFLYGLHAAYRFWIYHPSYPINGALKTFVGYGGQYGWFALLGGIACAIASMAARRLMGPAQSHLLLPLSLFCAFIAPYVFVGSQNLSTMYASPSAAQYIWYYWTQYIVFLGGVPGLIGGIAFFCFLLLLNRSKS